VQLLPKKGNLTTKCGRHNRIQAVKIAQPNPQDDNMGEPETSTQRPIFEEISALSEKSKKIAVTGKKIISI